MLLLQNYLILLLNYYNYHKGAYKDQQLSQVYFAGLEKYEEDLLMSTISANLDIKTSQFEPKNYTCDSNNEFPIHQYLMVGSLWRR